MRFRASGWIPYPEEDPCFELAYRHIQTSLGTEGLGALIPQTKRSTKVSFTARQSGLKDDPCGLDAGDGPAT